ncbi:hypothetical protein AMTRI_Chr02g262790 [Amborella trichopoda]
MFKNSSMNIFFTLKFKKEYYPQILINKFNHKLSKTIYITKNDKLIPRKNIVTKLLRIKNITKNINYRNKKVPIWANKNAPAF